MTRTWISVCLSATYAVALLTVRAEDGLRFAVEVAAEPAVVDFGPTCAGGYAQFEIVDFDPAASGAVLRVSYATHPDGLCDTGDFWRETAARYLGPDVDLPILPAAIDRFELYPVTKRGLVRARYLQGLVRYARFRLEGAGKVSIRDFTLVNDKVHSEGERAGTFRCSDKGLEGIWEASVRTCELSAIPSYSATHVSPPVTTLPYLADGAKRDRLVWSGDLWWAERTMFVGFKPSEPYMRGSLLMLAANRTPEGYVQACPWPEQPPPKAGEYGPFPSDEFAAWFVPVLWDYHLYRDDMPLLRKMWPAVCALLDYLGRHQGEDGIFRQRAETSKHAAGLVFGSTSCHHRSYMNIVLWLAYRNAAQIADVLGERERSDKWRKNAELLAKAVRLRFWNSSKGHFVLSIEDPSFDFAANAIALAAGLATPEEAARIMPQLVRTPHGKFQALAVRGKFHYGDAKGALAAIDAHNWRKMLSPDWKGPRLTSECMNLKRKGWGDEAHPDTALAGALVNHVLGIKPIDPGFRTFSFNPPKDSGLTFASGTVPTPHGMISAEWHIGSDGKIVESLTCPPGTVRVTLQK